MHSPLSILIPAKNESANIRACIESAAFADEIIVVDSSSTDGTQEIAAAAGAKVVDFTWDGRFPKKKNWSLAGLPWRNEWIFILDADERITPALADEIARVLKAPDADGYYVNRRFWFLGGWIWHCGYYPSWNLRLFRHRLGRYEELSSVADTGSGDNEVHEHVVLQGRAGRLRNDMEHYAFPSIEAWVEKHNRYSNWEARQSVGGPTPEIGRDLARKRRLKSIGGRLPFRPMLRFIYHYFLRAGFLDGYRGYVFCRLMAWYEFLSMAKAHELKQNRSSLSR